MPFVKGDPRINRAGRAKGAKDQKWKSIQFFWDKLEKEFDALSPAQRAHYAFEGFKLHFERAIAQIPRDQSDSVMNAKNMLAELQAIEKASVAPKSTPNAPVVPSEEH